MLKETIKQITPPGIGSYEQPLFSGASHDKGAPFDLWQKNINEGYGPIDPNTGIPLPIIPGDVPGGELQLFKDNHHAYFFRLADELQDYGGKVVRNSRLQRVPRWSHNLYHKNFRHGLDFLPSTEDQKFAIGVLSCAGIIPEYGVLLGVEPPKIVKLDNRDRSNIRLEGLYIEANYSRKYFVNYAIDKALGEVAFGLLIKFSKEQSVLEKRRLGWLIINQSLRHATDPILPVYKQARAKGLLDYNCPAGPADAIKRTVHNHPLKLIPDISQRINKILLAA